MVEVKMGPFCPPPPPIAATSVLPFAEEAKAYGMIDEVISARELADKTGAIRAS